MSSTTSKTPLELLRWATAAPAAVSLPPTSSGENRERRIIEARIATFVHQVAQTGLFAADKHRTPKAWGKAACNWSGAEAAKFVRGHHARHLRLSLGDGRTW